MKQLHHQSDGDEQKKNHDRQRPDGGLFGFILHRKIPFPYIVQKPGPETGLGQNRHILPLKWGKIFPFALAAGLYHGEYGISSFFSHSQRHKKREGLGSSFLRPVPLFYISIIAENCLVFKT